MEFQDRLKEYLILNLPFCTPASGGRFVVTKCPFCGDGKHHNSKHLYIGLGYDNDRPFVYCHLCHTYSPLTSDLLATHFGLFDLDIMTNLSKEHYRLNQLPRFQNKEREIYDLKNIIRPHVHNDKKLAYINKRLGSNLDFDDLADLKIMLSLKNLLADNNITTYSRDERIIDALDTYFMGFISTDNAFINMRSLAKKGVLHQSIDKRYVNYNIHIKSDNHLRMYTVPVNINRNDARRVKLHIAEGPFDILSILLNLRKDRDHNIYTAVCGSGYMNVLKQYINGYNLINMEVHIYRDLDDETNDSLYKFNQIYDFINIYGIPLYIHTNRYQGEKDFGVPIDRILEDVIHFKK